MTIPDGFERLTTQNMEALWRGGVEQVLLNNGEVIEMRSIKALSPNLHNIVMYSIGVYAIKRNEHGF